jgi:hypothetical protein
MPAVFGGIFPPQAGHDPRLPSDILEFVQFQQKINLSGEAFLVHGATNIPKVDV